MAATELSPPALALTRRTPASFRRCTLLAYGVIWALTFGSAALVALIGGPLARALRRLLGLTLEPQRRPPAQLTHVLALAAHNIPIVAWPLLLPLLGSPQGRLATRAADGLLAACVLVNVLPVGCALGAYGTALIPYIPQLPLEWAALALGLASWRVQRRRRLQHREQLICIAAIVSLLLCAASLETLAVPRRRDTMKPLRTINVREGISPGWTIVRGVPPVRKISCSFAGTLRNSALSCNICPGQG